MCLFRYCPSWLFACRMSGLHSAPDGGNHESRSCSQYCCDDDVGACRVTSSAIGQQRSLKNQLIGTWTLASWEHVLPDGSKVQSYGTDPKGIVVFDAKDRFFLMFTRPDLPKIASNAP